ncbi:MAG: hypothetical protein ACYC4L_14160 [Chloroflexota bacterium]
MPSRRNVMTPRQRILAALRGEPVDRVPFTCYSQIIPRGEGERLLREAGLALVERPPVVTLEAPNVRVLRETYWEQGILYTRVTWRTPVGDVYQTTRAQTNYDDPTTAWMLDYPIKRPDDYRVAEFIVKDTVFRSNLDEVARAGARLGEDGYVIPGMSSLFTHPRYAGNPMHMVMTYLLGVEQFAFDLYERAGEVLGLVDLLWRRQREVYPLLAAAPGELVIYGGNIHAGLVGRQRFADHYLPCWQALREWTQPAGKLIGCHFDADTGAVKDLIARAPIDVIEAFTPAPFTDLSLVEARQLWPQKVLWLNFTSNVHLEAPAAVQAEVRRLLAEAGRPERLLVGITEDVPQSVVYRSLAAIAQALAGE